MKLSEKLQNGLLAFSAKIEANKYLGSIKDAFTMYVPFIIIGSFGSMLNILVSGTSGLAQWFPWLIKLSPAFTAMNFVTISCMALPIAFLIGTKLAQREGLPTLESGLIGLLAYLAVCPNAISTAVEGFERSYYNQWFGLRSYWGPGLICFYAHINHGYRIIKGIIKNRCH